MLLFKVLYYCTVSQLYYSCDFLTVPLILNHGHACLKEMVIDSSLSFNFSALF